MSASDLQTGQRFLVNSFDLGFINIQPVDFLLEVSSVGIEELVLAPLPLPGQQSHLSLIRIGRWFREEYPKMSKDRCMLKNVSAFQRMIDCGAVVLQASHQDTPAKESLLTNIQQRLPWPSLTPGKGEAADH